MYISAPLPLPIADVVYEWPHSRDSVLCIRNFRLPIAGAAYKSA